MNTDSDQPMSNTANTSAEQRTDAAMESPPAANEPARARRRRAAVAKTLADTPPPAETLTRTLSYCVARLKGRPADDPGPTFETCVAKLHARTKDACQGRLYNRGDDEETSIWLNQIIVSPRSVTGLILMSDSSAHQQHVGVDFSQPSVPISSMRAPEGTSWQRGAIYFHVRDNHIVVVQSNTVRTSTMREYFNVMFHEHGILAAADVFEFVPPISDEFVQNLIDVKFVRLTAAPEPKPPKRGRGSTALPITVRDASLMKEVSQDVVAAVNARLRRRSITSALDPESINVELILRAATGRREAVAESLQGLIGSILSLTDGDPHAISMDADSATSQIRRNRVVMKAPAKLQRNAETMMPTLEDMELAAAEWLTSLLRTSQVR